MSDDALVRHVASRLDIPLQQGKATESTTGPNGCSGVNLLLTFDEFRRKVL
jgi:hypothetical protein